LFFLPDIHDATASSHARRNPQEEQNRRIENRKEIELMKKTMMEPEQPKERRTLQTCYVCNQKITGMPEYIGQDKYRHHRCKPGGARWMESEQAKKSDVTQYFLEPEPTNDKPK
jgi:hypothetical protein